MVIGIDASRAFIKNRTGIEEYSYQTSKHLIHKLKNDQVVLYIRKNNDLQLIASNKKTRINELELPDNWRVKVINWPRFWTQIGLSLEMLLHPVDALFVPAHTVPIIHPRNTIVTIHGLEYEFCPEAYSFWEKIYMRFSIKNSCRWARSIIAVSENTKNDLINLYKVPAEKIEVIYEGYNNNFDSNSNFKNSNLKIDSKFKIQNSKFILFIGRLEERKNIIGIIQAFEILKEQYKISYKLVLAGRSGYGYEKIKNQMSNVNCRNDIIELGFVNEKEKWELLKTADVFVFPTFYEGFGLPILEAQSVGVPVVASAKASIPEVVNICHSGINSESGEYLLTKNMQIYCSDENNRDNYSALLINSENAEDIADAIYKLISNEKLRREMVEKGFENVKRFSWVKCAEAIKNVILSKK
jgi:glycosyltransferase involved in cell wall biosynthesis